MKVVVGQGSCGVATGARKTSDELERLIAEKGLTNVAVDLTGCVGTCYLEPIVDVYGDDGALQARYVKVQPDKAAAIVEEHLMGGRRIWPSPGRTRPSFPSKSASCCATAALSIPSTSKST